MLAYDRSILWSALGDFQEVRHGPHFAEKIIQHEVALPTPSRSALLALLESALGSYFEVAPGNERFGEIVRYGLWSWIKTPRDSIRLGNAVNFTFQSLGRDIDPHDLLAMEGLRLFDAETFDWLRRNRDLVTGQPGLLDDEENKSRSQSLRNRLREQNSNQTIELLATLFPAGAKTIRGDEGFSGEAHYQKVARGGIGDVNVFDTYFGFFPPEGTVRKSEIDTLVAHLDDAAFIEKSIRQTLNQHERDGGWLVGELLELLRYRMIGEGPVKPTEALLLALSATGMDILAHEWTGAWFVAEPHVAMSNLFREMVNAWGPEKAADRFGNAIEGMHPTLAAFLYLRTAPGNDDEAGRSKEGTLPEKLSARIGKLALRKIENSDPREIAEQSSVWPTILVMEKLSGPKRTREWILKAMQLVPKFVANLPILSQSSGGRDIEYALREQNESGMYDFDEVLLKAEAVLAAENLDEKTKKRAQAIVDGIRKKIAREKANAVSSKGNVDTPDNGGPS